MSRATYLQKIIYRVTYFIFILTTVAGWFNIGADNVLMKFDKLNVEQEITGWGTSAAWWSQIAGDSENAEELARLLYSEEGLGLNIYRYNVGAGEKDQEHSVILDYAPHNYDWRASESFLVYNEETGEYEYDWTQDAAAQKMLDLCLNYGCIDTVVLFANSPHYSMTESGSATGSFTANTCNLKEGYADDFAEYMCDIAEYFISKGVPVKYISPINEPQWSWGGGWVNQEGCHYELDDIIEVGEAFAAEIKERNLDVKLSLAESGCVSDDTMNYIDAIYENEAIMEVLGTYAYHSYWTDDIAYKYAFGKYMDKHYGDIELEMSEWCELPNEHLIDDIDAGILMAREISEDVMLTGVNSWTTWVAVNDGLEYADSMIGANGDCSEFVVGKRYYAMAHFTKFVPVGSRAVGFDISVADIKAEEAWWDDVVDGKEYDHYIIENNLNVSTFRTPEGKYVAVIVNNGAEKKFTYTMPGYTMAVYTTDATRNLELTAEKWAVGSVVVPEKSIVTVEFTPVLG